MSAQQNLPTLDEKPSGEWMVTFLDGGEANLRTLSDMLSSLPAGILITAVVSGMNKDWPAVYLKLDSDKDHWHQLSPAMDAAASVDSEFIVRWQARTGGNITVLNGGTQYTVGSL